MKVLGINVWLLVLLAIGGYFAYTYFFGEDEKEKGKA